MRTLVIADIHGSAKALLQCLNKANIQSDDIIIQLGDVADGWSETSKCVDILLDLQNTNECHFIRGNHDVWVYDWLKYGKSPILWAEQGGKATLESYVKTDRFLDQDHKDFWFNQKDYYIDKNNNLFIHGGWYYVNTSFVIGANMPVNAGSIAKECHWDRDILRGAKSGSIINSKTKKPSGFKVLNQFNEIYIGHTATRSHLPENYLNLWNLDSGCGWHGKLTIMDINTKEYWQSDYSKDLYPNEKGR